MKLLGCTILIICGSVLGFMKVTSFKNRVNLLEDLCQLMLDIKLNSSFYAMSFQELLENSNSYFAEKVCKNFQTGINLIEAWNKTAKLLFDEEDSKILISFAEDFGRIDIDGQGERCQMYIEKLEAQKQRAIEAQTNKSKITFALYFSVFSLIAIVLI